MPTEGEVKPLQTPIKTVASENNAAVEEQGKALRTRRAKGLIQEKQLDILLKGAMKSLLDIPPDTDSAEASLRAVVDAYESCDKKIRLDGTQQKLLGMAYFYLGSIYIENGGVDALDQGKRCFVRAIKISDPTGQARYVLGKIHLTQYLAKIQDGEPRMKN